MPTSAAARNDVVIESVRTLEDRVSLQVLPRW